MNSPYPTPEIIRAGGDWRTFGRIAMLERWAIELKQITEDGANAEVWRLTGRAAMIAHPEPDECRPLLEKIAREAGMSLVEIESASFVEMISKGAYPREDLPALVFIPLGDWAKKVDGNSEDAAAIIWAQKNLTAYLAGIHPRDRLVFVTVANDYDELAPPLRSRGAFDRLFLVPENSTEETGQRFLNDVGLSLCDASLSNHPGKVGKLLEIEFDSSSLRGLVCVAMQRLAHREKRVLNFKDLVHFATYGFQESDRSPETPEPLIGRVAIHEAGHALVAIVDSAGRNFPEHCGVVPNHNFRGIVTDSYGYSYSLGGRITYRESCHKIRVALAGRAAEEVVLGAEQVGTWASRADLLNVTSWAKDLMGLCGFSPAMEKPGASAENLAVVGKESTMSEDAHIEAQVRQFLSHQYKEVLAMISANRVFLERLAERLVAERVLDQVELRALWEAGPRSS